MGDFKNVFRDCAEAMSAMKDGLYAYNKQIQEMYDATRKIDESIYKYSQWQDEQNKKYKAFKREMRRERTEKIKDFFASFKNGIAKCKRKLKLLFVKDKQEIDERYF